MSQRRHVKYVLFICLIFFLLWPVPFVAQAKTTLVTIGTGELMGRYYPTGGEIAEFVNKKQQMYGFRCNIKSTSGSVYNVNAIMADEIESEVSASFQLKTLKDCCLN